MLNIPKSKVAEILDPESGLPTDVTFKVEDKVFHGHKYFLALVSDVWKEMLFPSSGKPNHILEMEGATAQAFSTIMNILYYKEKDKDLFNKSVDEILEIARAADMFKMHGLLGDAQQAVENIKITMDNVVALAMKAEECSDFPSISRSLFGNCVDFLFQNLHSHVLDFSGLIISPQLDKIVSKLYNILSDRPLHFCHYCKEILWNESELHWCQHYYDTMPILEDGE